METLVDIFKALSDETRLRILNLLYERELCVCDVMENIANYTGKSIPASYLPQKLPGWSKIASRHNGHIIRCGMITNQNSLIVWCMTVYGR